MTVSTIQGPKIYFDNIGWVSIKKVYKLIQKCLNQLGEDKKTNFKPVSGDFHFCNLSLSSASRDAFLTYVKGCKELLKYPVEIELDVLDWIYVEKFKHKQYMEFILIAAAANGRLPFLYWAREKQIPLPKEALMAAALNGHLHVVKWLHYWGLRGDVAIQAASNGDVSMLEWAVKEGGYPCDNRVLIAAVENNKKEPLNWAYKQDVPIPSDLSCYAASCGHLEVLEFCIEIGCETQDLTWEAASCGKLETLIWLVESRRFMPVPADIYRAAQNGNVEIVKYLNDKVQFDVSMMKNYLARCVLPEKLKRLSEILNVSV